MAGMSTSGLGGSGLDVNSLVSQLVAAERAPIEQRLSRVETEINTRLSAFGTVRAGLSTLQGTLSAMKTPESLQARRTSSSDPTVFKATSSALAAPADYAIEVLQLATANKKASSEVAGGESATVGSGNLKISQNGQSFTIAVDGATTLSGLRDAINSAVDNTGVRASLLNTGGGTRLTLTSTKTGLVNDIDLSVTNPTGGFNAFVMGIDDIAPAQDASIKIDGFTVGSSTNTIAGAISGVSIDLLSAKPGSSLTLSVTRDVQATKDRIGKLVSDFNAFQTQAARLRAFDPKTKTGGPLIGDASLRNIEASIRRELTTSTASAPTATNSLSSIGIRFAADGRLTVNDATLTEAISTRGEEVAKMLTATDGLVTRLSSLIDSQISADGTLTSRTNSLDARKKTLDKDKEAMEARMLLVEKRYRNQFIGLDRMLTEMQGTSSYISKIGSGK